MDANERRQALLAARSLVDPVEVTDDAGTLVGYFAHDFVSLEDYPARLGEAKALLADGAARCATNADLRPTSPFRCGAADTTGPSPTGSRTRRDPPAGR